MHLQPYDGLIFPCYAHFPLAGAAQDNLANAANALS